MPSISFFKYLDPFPIEAVAELCMRLPRHRYAYRSQKGWFYDEELDGKCVN